MNRSRSRTYVLDGCGPLKLNGASSPFFISQFCIPTLWSPGRKTLARGFLIFVLFVLFPHLLGTEVAGRTCAPIRGASRYMKQQADDAILGV